MINILQTEQNISTIQIIPNKSTAYTKYGVDRYEKKFVINSVCGFCFYFTFRNTASFFIRFNK